MMKNISIICLIIIVFACKSNSNSITDKQNINEKKDLKILSTDSCQILNTNEYLDNLSFPLKKEKIFDATTLRKRSNSFMSFNKCDYNLFHLDKEKVNGLDEAAYISDYGIINGSRVVLIFVQYPNQYIARLVSFRNNNPIDKLNIAMIGFEEPPCDIKFNNDSILFKEKTSKASLLDSVTIETKNEVLFQVKNIETNQVSENIGSSNIEIFTIDSEGHFNLIDSKKTEEEYFKLIYECY